MVVQAKLPAEVLFKVIQFGYENFWNVKGALQNHIAKNIKLVIKLSIISNKTPNLHEGVVEKWRNRNWFITNIIYFDCCVFEVPHRILWHYFSLNFVQNFSKFI